jgi:hypothetical protein
MSEWLLLAGGESLSKLALVAAQALSGEPAQNQPLLQAIIRRDLEWALQSLKQDPEPVSGVKDF